MRDDTPAKDDQEESLEERLKRLEAAGILIRPSGKERLMEPIADRPGALRRFLESRGF